METFNSTAILVDYFLDSLNTTYQRMYGSYKPEHSQVIQTAAVMAMEIIANSNAVYHNAEHSMMVTLVGQEIVRGKYLRDGGVSAEEWVHYIVSLLCHDIGYVRGICPGDRDDVVVVDDDGRTVELPPGATDAALTPYHVERGKLFVRWRFRDHPIIDHEVIKLNIENTRFPVPDEGDSTEVGDYPGLVRAADLIGQLADPDYLRKLPALFHEFEETGATERFGYESPEDLREAYPDFYWKMASKHVQKGVEYLRVTREGREWEASLYSHVFAEEHRHLL
jgi:hypothetical protein